MSARAGFVLMMLLGGCATGREQPVTTDQGRIADRRGDGAVGLEPALDAAPPDAPRDLGVDRAADHSVLDKALADHPKDHGPADQKGLDQKAADQKTDAPKPCPDPYEPNGSCAVAVSLGSTVEGAGWSTHTATLDPATDVDWFTADGVEGSHTCFPLTSQCYVLRVQLQVPSGRVLELCLGQNSCTQSCIDNKSKPGPAQLDLQYQVGGLCGYSDDTTGKIQVRSVDGQGGCAPYVIAFRYDPC